MQPRRIALLGLLASDPHHIVSREKLITYLWPESDADQGRHRLSESLYVLRKDMGEEALNSEGESVRLNPERFICDVISFSEALEKGDREEAVALYAGPFMDGFFLKNAPEFDRWVEAERWKLAENYRRALEALATAADENGDQLRAVEWWSRLASHDPYNSRLALGCMEAMARAGDPGNAIYMAGEHARFLQKELGTEPTPELRTFAESLRNGLVHKHVAGGERGKASHEDPASDEGHDPASTLGFEEEPGETRATLQGAPRRRVQVAAASIMALLGVGAWYSPFPWRQDPDLIWNLVVVPPFENRTGDPALDEVAFLASEWVESTIQQVEGVQVVPSSFARQYAADAKRDGSSNPPRAVAERAKANWVVSGGVLSGGGDSLGFQAEIFDLSRHTMEQEVVKVGPVDPMNTLIDEFARKVAGALAFEFDPLLAEREPGTQPLLSPPSIDAFKEHRLGFEAYHRGDRASTFQHHMAAYALDSALVRALVNAAFMTNDFHVRDSLARFVDQRRHLLSRGGKLDLEILLATQTHDYERALRAYRERARLEGGGFSSVILSYFTNRLNLPGETLSSTERYDPTLLWRRDEADAYWYYRTYALHMLGEFKKELDEARQGREVYRSEPRLLRSEVRALAALGRVEEVSSLLHQARGLGDVHYEAALIAGVELREQGFLDASKDAFNRGSEWLTDGGPEEELGLKKRLHLAQALYGAERWEEAKEVSVRFLAELKVAGALPYEFQYWEPVDLAALGLVGLTAARLGDSDLASEVMDQLAGMSRRGTPGENLYLIASILAVLNRPDEAMKMLFRAFAESFPHGLRLHSDMNLESLRAREDFRGLVAPKG